MIIESTWAEDCADGRAEAELMLADARETGSPVDLFNRCAAMAERNGQPTGHDVGFYTALTLAAIG